ncbi:Hypothetical protein A7982_01067 [Minicystis rosea]|nr:Hypothetical protein A7982_01067 [Minicystis rosea]
MKLGEAIRDLVLRDEPENTAMAVAAFLEPLRSATPFSSTDANRWRMNILTLVDPTDVERAISHPKGPLHLRVLRLTRADKQALRIALWELYSHLTRDEDR